MTIPEAVVVNFTILIQSLKMCNTFYTKIHLRVTEFLMVACTDMRAVHVNVCT
jgi:hypothetical protein